MRKVLSVQETFRIGFAMRKVLSVKRLFASASRCEKSCLFVEGKSTKARAGMVVHLTAPNIHSTWTGNIVLEIVNFGPFDLVFHEGDAIAQLTVCKISSPPDKGVEGTSVTYGRTQVTGQR